MANMQLVNTDLTTVITSLILGGTKQTEKIEKKLGVKNNKVSGDLKSVDIEFFPGLKDNFIDLPVSFFNIIRRTTGGTLQVTSVVKEHADAVATKLQNRDKFYRKSGTTYTAYDTGNISFMATSSEEFHFLMNELYFAVYLEILTAGDYSGLTLTYWNGTAYTSMPVDFSDGTSGFTVDGRIFFGSLEGLAERNEINGLYMYDVKVTCSGVTTQAVADVGYYDSVYQLPKSCLYGKPSNYYRKNGSSYLSISDADAEYSNMGIFAFKTDPLSSGESLAIEYYYKNPQPGTHTLTFHHVASATWGAETLFSEGAYCEPTSLNGFYYEATTGGTTGETEPTFPTTPGSTVSDGSVVWTCRQGTGVPLFVKIDGGIAISITCDAIKKYTTILEGCEFSFDTTALVTQSVSFTISEDLKWFWFALDSSGSPGTYENNDCLLGDILNGEVEAFWLKVIPPFGQDGSGGKRYFEIYARETA